MSTHEQQTSTIPTSVVRNTGGKSGPQNLEEPASNEALRELCDQNYHELLLLIAKKMQKEKERQDKLKAVKARLLYGDESGRNLRNHKEARYSESKTPTARTEPGRRHGRKHSRSPSPVASVFRRLKQNRSPSPRLRPRKEGGVFTRLERKEPGGQSFQAKGLEAPARKHHHEGTSSRRTSGYSESEDSEGGHWKRTYHLNLLACELIMEWFGTERTVAKGKVYPGISDVCVCCFGMGTVDTVCYVEMGLRLRILNAICFIINKSANILGVLDGVASEALDLTGFYYSGKPHVVKKNPSNLVGQALQGVPRKAGKVESYNAI
ncbi:hypothetical protein Tco_1250970 [Tanacetum coccineum]